MKRYFYSTVLGLLTYLTLFNASASAQPFNYGRQWQFGDRAGIDFTGTNPVVNTSGAITSWEGCTSVCNAAGTLQFYSDGIRVFNRNNVTMTNGTGLLGNSSSSQSAIAFPAPGSTSRWYLTVVPLSGAMTYNIIDMSQSGGLGSVVTKNVTLFNSSGERQSVAQHANGTDFWIIGHDNNSNRFRAWRVTSTGVNLTPVVSAVGQTPASNLGCMKVSPNGQYIAYTDHGNGTCHLFDFNNSTGVVSNHSVLSSGMSRAYGLAFSNDNSRVYATMGSNYKDIYQWNLCAGDRASVISSRVLIGSYAGSWGGSLQLAPNGRIYFCHWSSNYLGVINIPTALGTAANYVDNGLYLNGRITRLGMPGYNNYIFSTTGFGPGCTVLSPELTTFYGEYLGERKVRLDWDLTETENMVRYRLERSQDGSGFKEIATLDAKYRDQQWATYNYIDEEPQTGSNYYRLAIEDQEGNTHYPKNVVQVNLNDTGIGLEAYPNPASKTLNLRIQMASKQDKGSVSLINALGQEVWNHPVNADYLSFELDLQDYAPGIYYVKYVEGSNSLLDKVVIQ